MYRRIIIVTAVILLILISSPLIGSRLKTLKELFQHLPTVKETLIAAYRSSKEIYHESGVTLTSNGVKFVIKSSIAEVSAAGITAAASARQNSLSQLTPLTISPSVEGVDIKIMNIAAKYYDGIPLPKGDYEISLQKQGYRPKNFWVTIGSNSTAKEYEVDMQVIGLDDCLNNFELTYYNSGFAGSAGRVFQRKALFKNTNIHDLYFSFAMNEESTNYTRILSSRVSQNYAEFHSAQPTHLTSKNIENNANIDIDADRFILLIDSFEQQGNDVVYVNQGIMPAGVFVAETSKEWFCEHAFNF